MRIGVPKEIKADERRVAIVPSGVAAFRAHNHRVMVEKGAGLGSGISDEAYAAAGAEIVPEPRDIWERAEMIIKVKEPLGPEVDWMQPGQIIYTYLHLASDETLTRKMLEKGVIGIGYETVQLPDASLPLLAPMSEVAGRLAAQIGAHCLEASANGMGILLGGVSGVKPANVTILGAGVAGTHACQICVSMGAHVTVLDINPSRLRYLYDIMASRVTTVMSNFGLYKALDAVGIQYEKTAVGDKYVYENMRENGHAIGGEQSGHIIFTKYANTGDGVLTAIKLMQVILDKKTKLSALAAPVKMYPQVLKNVVVTDKERTLADDGVQAAVDAAAACLGDNGRVLLRASGTEPVLRVMAEATTFAMCNAQVDDIIDAMQQRGYLVRVK